MNKDLSYIVLVVDRSGSMTAIKDDAQGGINTLIEEQKKGVGNALLTIVQFDDKYEYYGEDGKTYKALPIQQAGKYNLVPRGSTALLDAVGRAIVETGEVLSKTDEKDRPGLVIFAITTDGQENASREYTKEKVKSMITHQQDVYKWQFTYLGANQDAFAEAGAIGVTLTSAANFAPQNAGAMYRNVSAKLCSARTASAMGKSVSLSYTDADRKELGGES